jgi:hypothetical protein
MSTVIDMEVFRARRGTATDDPAVQRLERTVELLDSLLAHASVRKRIDTEVETELLAITGALSLGLCEEAAERAEALIARLRRRTG